MNNSDVEEFDKEMPTESEFSSFIHSNRPLVIRSYYQKQSQSNHHHISTIGSTWSEKLLIDRLGNEKLLTVARTPSGNSDSIVNEEYFVEPNYEKMTLECLINELRPISPTETEQRDVIYLQSQDNNLHKEFNALIPDIGLEVPIASAAIGGGVKPDAVNIWIGDDRSITSLHKVLEGSKTFTIFPPTEFYCMHETRYKSGRYIKDSETNQWTIKPNEDQTLIPWIPIDPLNPNIEKFPRFQFARAMTITLMEGDLLYLPSLWFHHVQQHRTTPTGLVVACNWW
ncbi:uncharacterized protein MELLADRAFT_63253 [Melampsora larici-populina 98AG31]|uniref:JmjC domain-containing protein n=1 Tax=Melampsora larici-populina (strain 98AG31 / pathotype 3-4-7) TaxID=747676 RepID=F4RLZ2_MELLP|nr:uncharacterized protein MELLADRAFT_63253 [Melampsora larici-populina 98AG31]EGG06679.1 hypothetical protein MELLADRAFT_63253 [Melampsora larici-populina 98AG31]